MTVYDRIKKLSKSDFEDLKKCGILKSDTELHLSVFESYTKEMRIGVGKMQAYINVGEEKFMSDSNVRKIVEKMSKKIDN